MIAVDQPVPAIVTQAAQQTRRSERGVVGFRVHRVFDVSAGPYHRHEDMQFAAVSQDGAIVKVRIFTQTIGGKETDDKTKAATAAKYEHPAFGDLLSRPFDERNVRDYRYGTVDAHTVRFTALVRDAAHADGTFRVDDEGNVLSMEYAPNVYPQHASGGTVTDSRAAVLPNYWSLTQEAYNFTGRVAIFGAKATATVTYGKYMRFSNVASALAALDAGSI